MTSETVSDYVGLVPTLAGKTLPPVEFSDVLRIALLNEYGGVWVDSTVFCMRPLDAWLPEHVEPSGFFAFANPGPDRMLSNWFLAATPTSSIIESWLTDVIRYWDTRDERDAYFWSHYLFADCYERDDRFRRAWDATPKVSADGPHLFYPYTEGPFLEPLTWRQRWRLYRRVDPVYKLSFHVDPSAAKRGSGFRYFARRSGL